jgi:anti-sigma regulatory factor (Ser/Thr protein kinase)
MAAKRFDPRPQFLADARAFVRQHTRGSPRAEDVEIAVSELATNAIVHAMTPFELSIDVAPQQIRLEVTDSSPVIPVLSKATGQRHGLHIVDALAERWGIHEVHGGKTIWAEFSLE